MPILQYQCQDCSSVFEYWVSAKQKIEIKCVNCGSKEFTRVFETCFFPKKEFCPKNPCKMSESGAKINTAPLKQLFL